MEIKEEGRFIGGYSIAVECSDSIMSEMLGCTPLQPEGDTKPIHPLVYQDMLRNFRNPRPNTEDHNFSYVLKSGAVLKAMASEDHMFVVSATAEEGDAYLMAQAGYEELRFRFFINKARVALKKQYALMGFRVKPQLEVVINQEGAVQSPHSSIRTSSPVKANQGMDPTPEPKFSPGDSVKGSSITGIVIEGEISEVMIEGAVVWYAINGDTWVEESELQLVPQEEGGDTCA